LPKSTSFACRVRTTGDVIDSLLGVGSEQLDATAPDAGAQPN
jgi:hypothetical protein